MTRLLVDSIVSTADKKLLETSGSVIAVSSFKSEIKTALSGSTDRILWSVGRVNKKIASSKLILMGHLPFRGGQSYFMSEWWRIGSSGKRYDGITQMGYNSDAGDRSVQFGWFIAAEYDSSETGELQVDIGHTSRNGGSDYPGQQWNPNFQDDARSQQKASMLVIYEVVK